MPFSSELSGATPSVDRARILRISLLVVPFSLVVCLIPHQGPVHWAGMAVAAGIAAVLAAALAYVGMFVPMMRRQLSEWELTTYLSMFTIAAGIAVYAGSGPIGVFRPILVLIIVWWAMWSDGMYLTYGTVLAIVTLGAATIAQGVSGDVVVTLMIEYGYCWGVTGVVIFMLVHQINRTRLESQRLAEAAAALAALSSVAARSRHLESALQRCVEIIWNTLDARRIGVVAVHRSEGAVLPIAAWPRSAGAAPERPLEDDLEEAARSGSPTLDPVLSLVPIGSYGGDALVLEIEGCADIERYGEDGTIDSILTVLSNMVERVSFMQSLEELTRSDPLTDLANRLALAERVGHDLDVARRTNAAVCVVMIDLDHFKYYNDTFGHLAGDRALVSLADMLVERCRSTDVVARYGGEEFCLGLPETNLEQARTLVESLLESAREIPAETRLTFSAGIAEWDGHESFDDLVERADAALYEAKGQGRDRLAAAAARASRD